jgi:glycerol-3-phosphate cytidylyltransferase
MKKVLYTGGTFDLFHAGHANFLKQCRNLAEIVIVSLNTDEFISQYKGKSPIISYEDRKNVLLSCRYVDNVIKNFGNEDSKPAILAVNPNIIAVGDDWACKDYYKQMSFTQEWLDEMGITLAYLPYTRGISSTLIKESLK